MQEDRWPPVYDAEDLVREIRTLTSRPDFEAVFYEWRADRSTGAVADVCQGDVVELESDIPVIGRDGHPGTVRNKTAAWLVLGNSCDFVRPVEEVRWTQLAPLVDLGGNEVDATTRDAVRRYSQARRFYVPPWTDATEHRYHVAELTQTVAVDKRVFAKVAHVRARMNRPAWILLNACLVRFLARDDGRLDE